MSYCGVCESSGNPQELIVRSHYTPRNYLVYLGDELASNSSNTTLERYGNRGHHNPHRCCPILPCHPSVASYRTGLLRIPAPKDAKPQSFLQGRHLLW